MFHVDCPKFRGFMSWDELGCLARAVGFPTDLFKSNVTKHVSTEEHGMSVEQVNRMLDLRLLQKSIHRTRNLHTGEWNTKVIRKSLFLMDHHALTFEELYNIRIAYKAFEGNDMRGMALDERVMLSALKMCGRSIAPLKMMHRIKHMSVNFEEPDRMQLFEFLDLVLWGNLYEEFSEKSMEKAEGKEGDLFRLVDFDRLLAHHDKKLADRLNQEYLQEEWDFGHETLTKGKFKEPPVVCGDSRIQLAREQKLKFRYLKSELVKSHSKLYRAKAGYIRDRPITAPDLSMYKEEEAPPPQQEFTAQDAYQFVQRKVKSANAALGRTRPDLSDKPTIPKPQAVWTAKAVSEEEIEETQKKYDELKFNIETVKGRFEYQKEKEIEYYFPGQLERLTKQQEEREDSVASDMKKSSSLSSKQTLTQSEVNRLAYPTYHMPPSHAKACDARFRGWHNVKKKRGSHYVLVAPTYDNSVHGRLHKKLIETSNAQVKKVKGDFVHRFTRKSEVQKQVKDMRPFTAPANILSSDSENENEAAIGITQSPSDSNKTVDTGYGSMEEKIGEGSSAESLVKSPDLHAVKSEESLTPRGGCPRSFETHKSEESSVKSNSSNAKDSKNVMNSEKQFLSSGPRAKTDIAPKVKDKVDQDVDNRPKTSVSSFGNQQNSSSQKDIAIKASTKYGFHKSPQTETTRKSPDANSTDKNVDLNSKIEHLKKDLNKHTTEKLVVNNRKNSAKSSPPLEFKFSSISTYSDDDDDLYVPPAVTSNKTLKFDDSYSSPDLTPRTPEPTFYTKQSPRVPEPKIYIKPKKEVIDIENLPVPQLQHSKPKTVAVGAIGKISLLESITESRFWEEVVEESYKRPSIDDVFVPNQEKLNPQEKELEDLKEEDVEDDLSSDSGFGGGNGKVKTKVKSESRFKGPAHNIDDKIMKAKMERLKRQKRVLKSSSTFEKLGISVAKPRRSNKLSSSSDSSNSNKEISTRGQSNNMKSSLTSKEQQKNDRNNNNNKCGPQEITKDGKENLNKTDIKQKKFCDSMKRLVNRMDQSLSVDMRHKMLSTRLS